MTAHRLHPTLADYVAIAINPVLVMGLVGSLIYFLLEVLYQGAYPDRLQFCLSMFVMGTVLISRIAMEDGFEHAAPFGAALAVVVALALGRFVEYGQGTLAEFGWAINWGLMALTWWCAHQLTWDCTLIDDDAEPDSQGLLETVGLDKSAHAGAAGAGPATVEAQPGSPGGASNRRGRVLAGWENVLGRKGRPHAPGVWIVYFSLASLPIFGIGQLCIPAANVASRRYVFQLLCVYVACGLGLLLTTSFLTLRRYLRTRRLEMPPIMAGTWLASGALMIVGLLLFVALLPRPNPEYAISELPLKFGSHDQRSSSRAVGPEGTRDEQAASGSGVDHSPGGQPPAKDSAGEGRQSSPDAAKTAAGDKNQTAGSGGQGKDGQAPAKDQGAKAPAQSPQQQSPPNQPGQPQPDPSKPDPSKPAQPQSSSSQPSPPQSAGAQTPPKQSQSPAQSQTPAQSQPAQSPPAQAAQPQAAQSPASAPSVATGALAALGGMLGAALKWVFYLVLIAAVAFFAWRSREALPAILQGWLAQLRSFWDELRGRAKPAAAGLPQPAAAAQRTLRFGDFADPFLAGTARQHAPRELIQYTFAALEAWSRDHGHPRTPDATPHEFARDVGRQFEPLAAGALRLADLYCRAEYAPANPQPVGLDPLAQLWQSLRVVDARLVAAGRE